MIGLPLTLLLTIFISFFFFFQKKCFTFLENSIVYMVMTILTTNVITILSLNLTLIKTTENPLLFPAVLLYRDGIIPLLVLILVNMFYKRNTVKRKVFSFILIFACLSGIDALLIFLEIIVFIKWNYFNAAIVNIAYLSIGLGITNIVVFISERRPER